MSPMSNGCLTKRKIHDPSTSCAVTENTNDSDSRVVPAVASVVTKDLFRKAMKTKIHAMKTTTQSILSRTLIA